MRKHTRFLLAAFAAIPASVLAQDAAPGAGSAQGDLGITIYSDRALVVDTRNLTLPGGVSRQEFPDVSAAIRPETVSLEASGVEVVEQNFDFDLLSPTSMMQAAVGEDVTLLRTDPATGQQSRETARVLAVNGGVVMQTADHIEVLRDDGLPVRVLFDGIPANLRARPTLSVTLEAATAGPRPVKLSYLTTGLGWKADYVALFDEPSKTIGLQGWVTLTNTTGTPFRDAKLTLAAGDLMKLQQRSQQRGAPSNTRSTGEYGDGEEETVGDLHLYPVEGRTTVASNQTKQVSFLDASGVAASRGYRFDCDWPCARPEPESATSVLRFSTGAKGGLGQSLPAGVVRVYMRDGEGEARFVGESRIEHTPTGSALDLETALAFDVKVQAIVEARERVAEQVWVDSARSKIVSGSTETVTTTQRQLEAWRTTVRYAFTNARPDEVEVELRQNELQGWYYGTRLATETEPGTQDGADTRVWKVKVPGRGKADLTVTYLTRF